MPGFSNKSLSNREDYEMSEVDLKAELERLKAENEALKKNSRAGGGLS